MSMWGTDGESASVGSRLQAWYYDTRALLWIAVALIVLGTVFFVSVVTSPGAWQWWSARAVRGTEQGGIVYYTYGGSNYTVNDPEGISNAVAPRTVYVDPSNPTEAVFSVTVAQLSDTLFVGLPYLAGLTFVCLSIVRHRRLRRFRAASAVEESARHGEDVVARLLAERRQEAQWARRARPPPPRE